MNMAGKVIKGKRTKTAVKKTAGIKKATSVRLAKKSKATSAAVLVLSGSMALRRRKAAETLAETLKVDLFRVDLSAVVSQYISETEQNLNDVFDKAEASGAILFFDEADVLFGTGSKVNDAHDQYANAETVHLLQRIESHNESSSSRPMESHASIRPSLPGRRWSSWRGRRGKRARRRSNRRRSSYQ